MGHQLPGSCGWCGWLSPGTRYQSWRTVGGAAYLELCNLLGSTAWQCGTFPAGPLNLPASIHPQAEVRSTGTKSLAYRTTHQEVRIPHLWHRNFRHLALQLPVPY